MNLWLPAVIMSLLQPAAAVQKPVVTPFFVTDAAAQGPAFFAECVNTTSGVLSSGSEVWPLSKTAIRLNGQQLIDEGGRIGPGLTTDVPPGGKWSGILQLRQSATGSSPAVAFGALVRAEMIVPLSAGDHTIAVKCGDTWSDPVRFFFETRGTPNAAYQSAVIDSNGRLVINTADRRTIHVLKEGEQSSFGEPKVSPDRTAVGVQALSPNCCTSYDISSQLVVYADGRQHRFRGNGWPIFQWGFVNGWARVAYGQEPVHFGCAVHYELRDVRTEACS